MTEALTYEWLRLRTLRSTWWLTGLAVLLGIGIALLISLAARSEISGNGGASADDVRFLPVAVVSQGSAIFVPYLLAYVVAMIGVFAWGHEYRHGMVRTTLTAVPQRTSVWVAKFTVVGLWVLAVSALTGLVSLLLGALVLSGTGLPMLTGEAWQMLGRCAVYALALTWLVTAFTAVVRHQVVALVLMFLWPFLIENVISGVVSAVPTLDRLFGDVVRYLPFDAGNAIIREVDIGLGAPLGAWAGFAVFAGTAVVLMVLSLVLFRGRDA
ncbi:MAG: ABC transporter permease subunit [Nocardioidaceae bacterium]|nr:ABC transporter permease subunit [Nocardioidaceae bacterium]NUS50854.1 ABC transporter permease subunit [Nocardioidaceae bacterium]